jgi:hypothetical protein
MMLSTSMGSLSDEYLWYEQSLNCEILLLHSIADGISNRRLQPLPHMLLLKTSKEKDIVECIFIFVEIELIW